jgi:hypothetical protein
VPVEYCDSCRSEARGELARDPLDASAVRGVIVGYQRHAKGMGGNAA